MYGEPIVIPPGNYQSYELLCAAILAQLQAAAPGSNAQFGGVTFADGSVTWDNTTNKISIEATYPATNHPELKFVCFTINPYNPQTGSIVEYLVPPDRSIYAFQNSYELYGGCYEDRSYPGGAVSFDGQFSVLKRLFVPGTKVGVKQSFTGSYNATLQTEENLYLRTDLHSSSYQTAGFDTGSSRYPQIVSSQILAKIPLNNPTFANTTTTVNQTGVSNETPAVTTTYTGTDVTTYERPYENLYYVDNGNDMYSILLESKKVNNIRLYITDSFGRLWPAISQAQIDCGKLNFTASLRVDVFQE